VAKKKIKGLGSQAVSKFFEQPEGLPEVKKTKVGRPRTIYREYEKSSQEGLREGYTRATFIVREDLLEKLKDLAYTERRSIKEVINEAIEQFIDGKEIITMSNEIRVYTVPELVEKVGRFLRVWLDG